MKGIYIIDITTEQQRIGKKVMEIKTKYLNKIKKRINTTVDGYIDYSTSSPGEEKYHEICSLIEQCDKEVYNYKNKLKKKKLIKQQNESRSK